MIRGVAMKRTQFSLSPEQRRERRSPVLRSPLHPLHPLHRLRRPRPSFPPPLRLLPQVLDQHSDLLPRDRREQHAVERRRRRERGRERVVERDERRGRRTRFFSRLVPSCSSSSCSSSCSSSSLERPQERGGLGGVAEARGSGLEGVLLDLSSSSLFGGELKSEG